MSIATIKLATVSIMNEFYGSSKSNASLIAKQNLERYIILNSIAVDKDGEDAADEVFDITNNPDRDDERRQLYGNQRSLSVGDIVQVQDQQFVCCSIGWTLI